MKNPFRKSYSLTDLNMFRTLNRVKMFDRLNYDELALFLPFLHLREYKSEEVVFFRNDPSNALYIVKSGKISINLDVQEEMQILQILKSGEFFGQNALLEDTIRLFTAIVVSEVAEIYVLPKVNVIEIFKRHSRIRAKVMTSLAELYNEFNTKVFKSYRESLGFFTLDQAFNR